MGLVRPEITHYRKQLCRNYEPPKEAKILFLVPQTRNKPFHKAPEFKKIRQLMRIIGKDLATSIHICVYSSPFGIVPLELDEVYPLSQHESSLPFDIETINYVANQVLEYIKRSNYAGVVLLNDQKLWFDYIKIACSSACKDRNLTFDYFEADVGSKEILVCLEKVFRKQLSE